MKIVIFGLPGSGKTTMAKELAEQLDLPHIALDSILFTEHGPLPLDEFRAQATDVADGDAWIVEGNFSKLADVVWHRADVLVWLDYRLPVIVWRIVRRSLRQLTGLAPGPEAQRLTWRRAFFARRSVLRNAIRKYRNNRPRYAHQIDEAATLGVRVLRFRNPTDARIWTRDPLRGVGGRPSRARWFLLASRYAFELCFSTLQRR